MPWDGDKDGKHLAVLQRVRQTKHAVQSKCSPRLETLVKGNQRQKPEAVMISCSATAQGDRLRAARGSGMNTARVRTHSLGAGGGGQGRTQRRQGDAC